MAFKLAFWGGADEVTGSRHLIDTGRSKVFLDCGLFQGHRKEALSKIMQMPVPVESLNSVLLSHAHIDHSGGLPLLAKNGYRGPIYSTPATRDICEIMLKDSAFLQVEDAKFFNKIHAEDGEHIEPLYEIEDAEKAMGLFQSTPYEEVFAAAPDIHARFLNAGHVLGSAMIEAVVKLGGQKRTILFTGDLGRRKSQLMHPPEPPSNVDYLITESTYGNRRHDGLSEGEDQFAKIVAEAIKNKSKLLIPSFALERTQEILFVLTKLRLQGRIGAIPVYLDSPMAIGITEIFKQYGKEIRFNWGDIPKDAVPVKELVHYVRSSEESKRLNEIQGPLIIIAASGMCEGGRILHHLRNNIADHNTIIALAGYQAEGTLGRRLLDGESKVRIFGMWHEVAAQILSFSAFSAHADQEDLLWFIGQIKPKPKMIFLVHGDRKNREALRDQLKARGFNAHLPRHGESASLT